MAVTIVDRDAGGASVVARTPTTALDVLASAVFWIDADLSTITDDGEPT